MISINEIEYIYSFSGARVCAIVVLAAPVDTTGRERRWFQDCRWQNGMVGLSRDAGWRLAKAEGAMKRASVTDVSRLAGVSTATVSRVLNDPEKVLEPTRAKVLAAIEELHFVKSATGFSLKAQQSNNVLVVVSSVGNIYYSEIFEALKIRAEDAGYNIIITSPSGGTRDSVLDRLRTGRVDGVIILDGYTISPEDYDFLTNFYQGTPPIVGFAEKRGILPFPQVFIDNYAAAHQMTRYLIDAGHTHIGHIPGPANYPPSGERLRGFRDAMAASGLSVADDDIFEGGFKSLVGRKAAHALLARTTMPTAIFCANDESAMGLISELVQNGIDVPGRISVAGFDDCSLSDVYSPPLTTLAQPRGAIGTTAMDLLLEVMHNPDAPREKVVVLDVTLMARKTVAPPCAGLNMGGDIPLEGSAREH